MAGVVHRVVKWLPPNWRTAIERESREWRARCPGCLGEVSVWELGGVRFKALGNPARRVKCPHCSTSFSGPLYHVDESVGAPPPGDAATEHPAASESQPTPVKRGWGISSGPPGASSGPAGLARGRLWVDGAGSYLLLAGRTITVGSPSAGPERPDIAIMAAISRRQAELIRTPEGFVVIVTRSGDASGRLVRPGETFGIGGGVELRARLPNPLSQTAVLEIVSSHRTEPRSDGIILLDQVCVLGSAADSHLRNPLWPQPLLLFRRDEALWCKAIPGLRRNGKQVLNEELLENGDVLTTDDLRLRVELSCGA